MQELMCNNCNGCNWKISQLNGGKNLVCSECGNSVAIFILTHPKQDSSVSWRINESCTGKDDGAHGNMHQVPGSKTAG